MFKYIGVILGFSAFLAVNCFANDSGIVKMSVVDKLCQVKSLDILEEQGLSGEKWSSQSFNGDRTFNIEGQWITNAGTYGVECELPYRGNETNLTMILTKS